MRSGRDIVLCSETLYCVVTIVLDGSWAPGIFVQVWWRVQSFLCRVHWPKRKSEGYLSADHGWIAGLRLLNCLFEGPDKAHRCWRPQCMLFVIFWAFKSAIKTLEFKRTPRNHSHRQTRNPCCLCRSFKVAPRGFPKMTCWKREVGSGRSEKSI